MNKIKIWLNKNISKIFIIALLIIMSYLLLKGLNDYNESKREQYIENNSEDDYTISNSNNNTIPLNTIDTALNTVNGEESLPKVNKQSNEFKNIITVVKKILNTIHQANNEPDNILYKESLYKMLSDEFIKYYTNGEVVINSKNVLDYIFKVENINDFSIGNVYRYLEKNNVVRYEVYLRYKNDGGEPILGYLILNLDYNNSTFSYGGFWSDIYEIDGENLPDEIIYNEFNGF